jgi:hypothetical protein
MAQPKDSSIQIDKTSDSIDSILNQITLNATEYSELQRTYIQYLESKLQQEKELHIQTKTRDAVELAELQKQIHALSKELEIEKGIHTTTKKFLSSLGPNIEQVDQQYHNNILETIDEILKILNLILKTYCQMNDQSLKATNAFVKKVAKSQQQFSDQLNKAKSPLINLYTTIDQAINEFQAQIPTEEHTDL